MHRRDDSQYDSTRHATTDAAERNERTSTQENIAERVHRNYDTEVATDFTESLREKEKDSGEFQNLYGWLAVVLSLISFFIAPLFFAIAGIILGIIARNRDATILGYSAIAIAIVSLVVQLFIMPFVQ